jgi:hypothetical protein
VAISVRTRKLLWGRAGDCCAFPQCRQRLTVDQLDAATGEEFPTVVGEEAHVRSSRPDGPRHDPDFDPGLLDDYQNLILLCPVHHSMVDAEGGRGYDVKTLLAMRREHEKQHARTVYLEGLERIALMYVGEQFHSDDRILFEQAELRGPSVDSMFVDVPFSCRRDTPPAEFMERIATGAPGDVEPSEEYVIAGAAQALLHTSWKGNAILLGGPGAGKSTLLQYVCQFHRARWLQKQRYTGHDHELKPLTEITRFPIRVDLRKYAEWARPMDGRATSALKYDWRSIEQYIAHRIEQASGGHAFSIDDLGNLLSTRPSLLALDGLDEVANLEHRSAVSEQIVRTYARQHSMAEADIVVLVATRPGATTSALWSSRDFPIFNLQRLTHGLRVQYLQKWSKVARLSEGAFSRLQRSFLDNQHVPHIRELASYPMQLAILLHLLHRRQLLPQQRTELYREYLKTFLDREQTEDKEPLLSDQRKVIEDIHAYLGWHLQTRAEQGLSSGSIKTADLKRLVQTQLAGRAEDQSLARKLFAALSSRVLCLVERESGYYQFEVQSLREYFAAVHIFDNAPPRGRGNSRDDCLNALLERPYWSNVCRFFVGMFSGVEVRGIRHNLRALSTQGNLGTHPLLRSTAALLLDDRAFQGQPDDAVQEIVDCILDGPGVILAEDGLLDVSGAPLELTTGAGRAQAVRHLKRRLVNEPIPELRQAIVGSIRRHATDTDELGAWWWEQFSTTFAWFETASQLAAFRGTTRPQAASLSHVVSNIESDSHWLVDLLVRGGYDGQNHDLLAACVREINEGSGEVARNPPVTSALGRLLQSASIAQLRSAPVPASGDRTSIERAGRNRNSQVAKILAGTENLFQRAIAPSDVGYWVQQLNQICSMWMDGWILRQAVASLPGGIDMDALAAAAVRGDPLLARHLDDECETRKRRGDSAWWHERLKSADPGMDERHWVFSLLANARVPVVVDVADELNQVVSRFHTKHIRAVACALHSLKASSRIRVLTIQESLRRNQASFSPKTLWLLRQVVADAGIDDVDKKLQEGYPDLLQWGMGDMRPVLRKVGAEKTIKIDQLSGSRSVIPVGGWASDVKLGALRRAKAAEILTSPANWPADIVQRAVEVAASQMSAVETISAVASANNWFQESE